MNTKLNITTDKDEVLLQYMKPRNAFHNWKYNTHFKIKDYHAFSYKIWGISTEQVMADELEFYESDFFKNMEPVPYAYESLEYLSDTYNISVLTSSEQNAEIHTLATFERLFENHHFNSIHHLGHANPKWEKCEELGGIIHLDDYYGHLLPAATRGTPGIMFKRIWNERITELHPLVKRVRNWEEAVDFIIKMEKR